MKTLISAFISFLFGRKAKLALRVLNANISDKKFMGNSTVVIAGTLIHVANASANCEFHYFGSISI
jgi:hypothetical protein